MDGLITIEKELRFELAKDPDHITTAVSFDGRFLRTVGGNQGSDG